MSLFEKELYSSRSKMNPIEIKDVIEDIKLTSLGSEKAKELDENGYLRFIKKENDFDGDMYYFIKPSKEIFDYMADVGYGTPDVVEYSEITNAISFHTIWKSASISMNTTPQIAGVLNNDELNKKLDLIEYEGDCQVNKAYTNLYRCEPNYAMKPINVTGNTLLRMQQLSRKIWLAAGYMLNDNSITKKAHNGEYDNAFKDHDKMSFLKQNFEFEKPFYVPQNKNISKLKR